MATAGRRSSVATLIVACLGALIACGACGRTNGPRGDGNSGARPAARVRPAPAAPLPVAFEAEGAQAASGPRTGEDRYFSEACLQCATRTCGMFISLCNADARCGSCLAGESCAAASAETQKRWQHACSCVSTSCYAPCFMGAPPKPVCPATR